MDDQELEGTPIPEAEEQVPETPEVQDYKKKYEELERLHKEDTRRITELKKAQKPTETPQLAVQMEKQNKLMELSFQREAMTPEQFSAAKARIEAEAQQRIQALGMEVAYSQYTSEQRNYLEEILDGEETPEAKAILENFDKVAQENLSKDIRERDKLDRFAKEAAKLIKGKAKPVDTEKIKEEIRKEVMEELKRGGAYTVDKGVSSGGTPKNIAEARARHARGEISTKEAEKLGVKF